jgi:hypothetical protein
MHSIYGVQMWGFNIYVSRSISGPLPSSFTSEREREDSLLIYTPPCYKNNIINKIFSNVKKFIMCHKNIFNVCKIYILLSINLIFIHLINKSSY